MHDGWIIVKVGLLQDFQVCLASHTRRYPVSGGRARENQTGAEAFRRQTQEVQDDQVGVSHHTSTMFPSSSLPVLLSDPRNPLPVFHIVFCVTLNT